MSRSRTVVVAHEERTIRSSAAQVLRRADFRVVAVGDGESVQVLLDTEPAPAVVVLDVALSDVPFTSICRQIEARQLPTRTLLIASVYSRTAYKRRPTSLLGADDYIEQHHIIDSLAHKVDSLVRARAAERPLAAARSDDPFEAEDSKVRVAGERRLRYRHSTEDEATELAERLARVIVADLALYSGDEIRAWQRDGIDIDRMPEALKAGLEEARRIFEDRVPPELAFDNDYVLEALVEFANETR